MEKSRRMNTTHITVDTLVTAPLNRVWLSWTKPEEIQRWNFATDDWRCPTVESDLKIGGHYKARMEAKDGSFGFDFAAVFEEIEPHQSITMVMDDGRRTHTTFVEMGNGTQVTTTFDAEMSNPIEMQRDGWQAILNNFKRHVETSEGT